MGSTREYVHLAAHARAGFVDYYLDDNATLEVRDEPLTLRRHDGRAAGTTFTARARAERWSARDRGRAAALDLARLGERERRASVMLRFAHVAHVDLTLGVEVQVDLRG